MITCYIIDDEKHAIDTLKNYIDQIPDLKLIGSSQNSINGFNEVLNNKIDITFLDVDMPGLSGLDVVDLINKHTAVVFTTAFPNYALSVFEKNVADFLLKPIPIEKFIKAVERVRKKLQIEKIDNIVSPEYIYINPGVKGKITKIILKDILYIEGLKNYVLIHTKEAKYLTYLTMLEIEEGVGSTFFKRIHKSYIVNLNKILSVERGTVLLEQNIAINIGLVYKDAFLEEIRKRTVNSSRT